MTKDMMGRGMWEMGLIGILVLIILILVVAALVKYVFFRWRLLFKYHRTGRIRRLVAWLPLTDFLSE